MLLRTVSVFDSFTWLMPHRTNGTREHSNSNSTSHLETTLHFEAGKVEIRASQDSGVFFFLQPPVLVSSGLTSLSFKMGTFFST